MVVNFLNIYLFVTIIVSFAIGIVFITKQYSYEMLVYILYLCFRNLINYEV